jgi:hypothetical protein
MTGFAKYVRELDDLITTGTNGGVIAVEALDGRALAMRRFDLDRLFGVAQREDVGLHRLEEDLWRPLDAAEDRLAADHDDLPHSGDLDRGGITPAT